MTATNIIVLPGMQVLIDRGNMALEELGGSLLINFTLHTGEIIVASIQSFELLARLELYICVWILLKFTCYVSKYYLSHLESSIAFNTYT